MSYIIPIVGHFRKGKTTDSKEIQDSQEYGKEKGDWKKHRRCLGSWSSSVEHGDGYTSGICQTDWTLQRVTLTQGKILGKKKKKHFSRGGRIPGHNADWQENCVTNMSNWKGRGRGVSEVSGNEWCRKHWRQKELHVSTVFQLNFSRGCWFKDLIDRYLYWDRTLNGKKAMSSRSVSRNGKLDRRRAGVRTLPVVTQ